MMDCRDVRQHADAYLSNEVLVETRLDIMRHLEGCPACRADLEQRQALRTTMRRAFLATPDLEMRASFGDALRQTLRDDAARRAATPAARWRWAAAAAGVLAVAASLFLVVGWDTSRLVALAREAWGDHRNCAIAFHLQEKPISLEEASWTFDPAFAHLQTTPGTTVSTPVGDALITERHSCVFAGRRYAHLVMRFRGELVSLLVAQDDAGPMASAIRMVTLARGHVRMVHVDATDGAALFRTAAHMGVIVGSVPDSDLEALADALVQPVSNALAL
jgi:anti-sigma factor RsiW